MLVLMHMRGLRASCQLLRVYVKPYRVISQDSDSSTFVYDLIESIWTCMHGFMLCFVRGMSRVLTPAFLPPAGKGGTTNNYFTEPR